MIRINLLPIRQIKKKEKARQQLLGSAFALVATLSVLGVVGLQLSRSISSLESKIQAVEDEKVQYVVVINKMKELQQKNEALEKKLEVIASLRDKSKVPVRILDEIASTIPANHLWLKSLAQNQDTLQLSGVALDNATIADYMKRLSSSPYFSNADLGRSALEMVAGRKLKTFALSCSIVTSQGKTEN